MSLYATRVLQDNPLYLFENSSTNLNNSGSRNPTITLGSLNVFNATGGVGNSAYMTVGSITGSAYGFEYSDSATTFNDKVFSISGWAYLVSGDIGTGIGADRYIFKAGTNGSNGIGVVNGVIFAIFNNVSVSYTMPLNAWTHIAVTVDSTNINLYINGSLVSTKSTPSTISMDSLVKYWMRATTSGGITYEGSKGKFDEWAVFDTTLSSTTISDHYTSGFGVLYNADPSTAAALAVDPTVSVVANISIVETPATATADIGDIQVSNFNTPTMLDGYMAGLSLEQWYKFDELGKIKNYGSGGNAETAWAFNGVSTNIPQAGIQGSGTLKFKGEEGNSVILAFGVTEPYVTEITDNEFSAGVWFKAEPGFGDNAPRILVLNDPFGDHAYNLIINNEGKARWVASTNQPYIATYNLDICDNNWHFIQVRASDSNNMIGISVDNGTEVTASITGNNFPENIGYMSLAQTYNTGANNKYGYISHFWVSPYATVGSTERAAIIAAAGVPIQASAGMVQPRVRFENAFNDKIQSHFPILEFRLDETTGATTNFGSLTNFSAGINGSNITYGNASLNKSAYRFTNALTYLQGDWTAASGTFSTLEQQTVSVVFKANGYTAFEQIIASSGMYGFIGTGITIAMNADNGHLTARLNQGFGEFDTEFIDSEINVGDNKWHHAVAVKGGSNFKLYLDGKNVAGITNSVITPSDAGTWAVSGEGKYNFGQGSASKDMYIDEFALIAADLSAAEVFELYQSIQNQTEWTASALNTDVTVATGTGAIVNSEALTASAESPFFIAPSIYAATANTLFQQPNFEAIKNTDNLADPMTAEAQGENPGWDIGENNQVLHMDASAEMGDARALIPGFWNASPTIANASMVEPALSTTLGALVKPQSLNAKAAFILPPAYYLISDDAWYQRLLDVDYQSAAFGGKITFFNTSDNIYLDGGYDGWEAEANRNPLQSNYGYNLYDSPLPVASAGYFDPTNRKALNLRNIALIYTGRETYSQGWTMEAMIQTTKKNQFITAGYYLGDTSSSVSRSKRTAFRLNNGKIALTNVKDSTLGQYTSADSIAWTGFKDIADGNWHHVILQYRDDDNRVQVWIDGELDIQRYGSIAYIPNQIGFNSNDANAYSDFNISGVAINKESFVLERETYVNYLAAFGITPIEATPAQASMAFGTETRGKGNRARALMLYFWPTFNAQRGYYVGQYNDPFAPVGINTSKGHDVGAEPFDYDTFYGLTTYLTNKTQTFFDWDVFPLPVKQFYSGDTYRGDKNPLLNDSVLIGSGPNGTTYIDPVTDNYRYVNLMEDVYELDQYDAIFFRNYPDQSKEQDEMGLNSKTEVDQYFNIQEKTLFAEFLDNLREAIDTYGISLFVTNPQLAKDLGIIANATEVPLLRDQGNFYAGEYSDNRAPVVTGRAAVDGTPTDPVNEQGAMWYDTWFNDRHRVINQLEYLTDDNAFIWTDYAFYQNSDVFEYGGPDRLYKRYENRPNGLQIDDEFVFADSGNPRFRLSYQAVKPEDILAGIPITALSKKIWNQNFDSYVQVDNPYKDYVTTIALPVGTNLKGKLTSGKIFVSFSENVANSFTSANPQFDTSFVEYHEYDMASKYWVDIAYNAKIITDAQKAQYLAGTAQQPPLYDDNNPIKQYWSLSGDNIISRVEPVTQNLKGFVGGDISDLLQNPLKVRTRSGLQSINAGERLRDALGRFASGGGSSSVTGGNLQTFKIITGRTYDTGTVFIPSINTRALWWLSDKVRLTGKVVGAPAMKATASMPDPLVEADHPNTFIAGAMIATATIAETSVKGPDINVLALPMYTSATITGVGGKNILAGTGASATAGIVSAFAITQGPEQVIVYLHHVDPILYLRKEIIR